MEDIFYAFNPWWENRSFATGILRSEYIKVLAPFQERRQVELITGSRRAGKTTLLKQLIKTVLDNGTPPETLLFLALDHPRLSSLRISEHLTTFRKLFLHARERKLTLFLDEVQDSPDWEAEIKSLYDMEDIKILCTGSTSFLINTKGGKLTGRQISTTIYPLSFSEYLLFTGQEIRRAESYKYEKCAEDYITTGGYPEYVLNRDELYLSNLIDYVIARDIAGLFRVQKTSVLKDLFRLISSSVGSRISFNRLSKILGVSLDTIKEYLSCFEAAFLMKSIEKWSTSYNERIYSQKKCYLLDTGLKTLFTGKGDLGAKAENAIFTALLRHGLTPSYWAENGSEVDFIVETDHGTVPIEVKYIPEIDYSSKAFNGVRLFFTRNPGIKKALIITMGDDRSLKDEGHTVQCIPLWRFLLGDPRDILREF